ncbi:phosphoribosylformylglycinamidine synthase [Vallitalea okinawensis]|uniref:phosphoribosylformylglycinamidine synthase n=1 Tax=Vallitalea okinawensis TaxID=2078660 RepID=UPI000CFD5815|nr:phosphoribosylformylglycinamidine synthase [Vallitalea okinawensis]
MSIRRIYVEKKEDFRVEAKRLKKDFRDNLGIETLTQVRVLNRYDIEGLDEETFKKACQTIFSEVPVDRLYHEIYPRNKDEKVFAVEYLPGQYDQRADSAEQCIRLINPEVKAFVKYAKVIVLDGEVTDKEIHSIKDYYINPVDSREASLEKAESLQQHFSRPDDVKVLAGFNELTEEDFVEFKKTYGLAMSIEDLLHTQEYFSSEENRDPSMTELKVLDTYWSDHCRHTTFLTRINQVEIEEGSSNEPLKRAYDDYLEARNKMYQDKQKDMCLMDIALMAMKELRKDGKLDDLEVSDEINACSIKVKAHINDKEEDWLVMFKNETHNHPTEIEPFGGAATCLGGAIRDPLSGRSYVYQAMRITGSGDPREKIEDTIDGKLPQRKIAKESAHGYSSYGNQIGLATGQVVEIYHDGYKAKHMELGAVIAATPAENVFRGQAEPGDIIVLLGGQTGRDGCGGATGSSKEHTVESISQCGSEVQKGNPPTERKIQRLFRNPNVAKMIKKCNDFGAGGVSVAIGELADGLIIDMDQVPKKYEGLDGTELAISESQERMAVVLSPEDVEQFRDFASEENLESTVVAKVTEEKRLVMTWRGKDIVNVSREFLDTNGATQTANVFVKAPAHLESKSVDGSIKEKWLNKLSEINVASQKGLGEMFDSTIGAGTVLQPFGGTTELTPEQAMVAKIPVIDGDTTTGTIMTYGYDPYLSQWSPFHGAYYAVIESVAKVLAAGGKWRGIRFTFQEYFERLNKEQEKWGKPFSALLGAYYVQKLLGLPSIGGKDSMSGTFHEISVPPTLVSFAVNVVDIDGVKSSEFKKGGSQILYVPLEKNGYLPEDEQVIKLFDAIEEIMASEDVLACRAITGGGLAEGLSKMSFGNNIGLKLNKDLTDEELLNEGYGSFILEVNQGADIEAILKGINYHVIGETTDAACYQIQDEEIRLEEAVKAFTQPLEKVYPTVTTEVVEEVVSEKLYKAEKIYVNRHKVAKPKVIIPVFPGTNCEYDTAKQFREAGAEVDTLVFRNLTSSDIDMSINRLAKAIDSSQIIALAGGFSAGDEPDGSGKFITSVFRNPKITEATMNLLNNRDGLMLGICNGFQALIKLGLLPYGEIRDLTNDCPTLTYNTIGRHVSTYVHTKIVSNQSPWLQEVKVGDVHAIPVSHGEGRFIANDDLLKELYSKGQIGMQYVNEQGQPTMNPTFNPNGSYEAIEGILSPDGRILGKMGHSERIGQHIAKNIYGEKDQKLFLSGVKYFK